MGKEKKNGYDYGSETTRMKRTGLINGMKECVNKLNESHL